jgi:hypothetical protein
MSYCVNTGEDKFCDKCKHRIGIAKGFYTQWGRFLCCNCHELFIDFVKEKYQEFIYYKKITGFIENEKEYEISLPIED